MIVNSNYFFQVIIQIAKYLKKIEVWKFKINQNIYVQRTLMKNILVFVLGAFPLYIFYIIEIKL